MSHKLSNTQIARELTVSPVTVRTHVPGRSCESSASPIGTPPSVCSPRDATARHVSAEHGASGRGAPARPP